MNATALEGDIGRPEVALDIQLAQPADHDVAADGTAHSPGQYDNDSGTISIPAGATDAKARVVIRSNTIPEPTKTFTVVLSNAVGASIDRAVGTVTTLAVRRVGGFSSSGIHGGEP
jgi:hypothetical protein